MKLAILTILFLFITYSITCAQNKGEGVTDIDGNTYSTVIIGNQEWMAENLRSSHYANGDVIPNVTDNNEWSEISTGAWANYDNKNQNGKVYGKLYNWYAVTDSRNICPHNWHVPSDDDWKELELYLGLPETHINSDGFRPRGFDENIGGKLKSTGTSIWIEPNHNATNESGFSAIPGGSRHHQGNFTSAGSYAYFWSASKYIPEVAWYRRVSTESGNIARHYAFIETGMSIRCVKSN